MKWQPTLSNDLLEIRPLSSNDFEQLFTVASDPLIWEQHYADRYKKAEFERFFQESIESKGAMVILDKTKNEIIGSSRYEVVENSSRSIEIGWTFIAKEHWGGVVNLQVKTLMINHALAHVDHVLLYIDVANLRSQKAAEKINARLSVMADNLAFPSKGNNKLIYYVDRSWNSATL